MTTIAELVLLHAGHRTTILEPSRGRIALKCFTCDGRLTDLSPALLGRPGSAPPTVAPRDPKPDETCARHPGEFRTGCRPCASERLERHPDDPPPVSQVRTGADPATVPEVAAAKARLAELARTREARQRARHTAAAAEPVSPPDPIVNTQPAPQEATP